MRDVTERFTEYASIATASCEESTTCPSTEKQMAFAKKLADDLHEIGLSVTLTKNGYVYAELDSNSNSAATVGFIAHYDTSPDAPDTDIKPRRVVYDGNDIVLNEEKGIVLSKKDYPYLDLYLGEELIVTDGTTLLGADDKAGVCEIMAALETVIEKDLPHGKIKIGFTPDEEIGRGADFFDVKGFGADYAYTVDGGRLGEVEFENFNAASATAEFFGISIHPGDAKGKMKNACDVAHEFHSMLPELEKPVNTEGYEGFFHLTDMKGDVEKAELKYIIRDHDREMFLSRKDLFRTVGEQINEKYGAGSVKCTVTDSYYNMKEMIEPHMYIIDRAKAAFEACGVTPAVKPIRGGTDGARLSYEDLPCPNLSTGGENFHSRFEFIPSFAMRKMVDVIVKIITDLTVDDEDED